jgi:hypothetical protein
MDRRKFLAGVGRWFLAGGLIGTSGLLIYRGRVGDPRDCFANPYCKLCGENKSCNIAAALNPDNNEEQGRK